MAANYYNLTRTSKGFPVGAIVPFAGDQSNIPTGWIPCDGRTLEVAQYPALYQIIGNTYGGNVGNDFKSPRLNDGSSGIMDIFRGHFQYLQSEDIQHRPEKTNISDDAFWDKTLDGPGADNPSSTQTSFTSIIDVEGVLLSTNELVGQYSKFEFSEGEYFKVLLPAQRLLSDRHIPSHTHNYNVSGSSGISNVSYTAQGRAARDARTNYSCDPNCRINYSSTSVSRTVPYNINGRQMSRMTSEPSGDPGTPGGGVNLQPGGFIQNELRWGGGSTAGCQGGGSRGSSVCYDPRRADGFTGGDMWASSNNFIFSSLAPITVPESADGQSVYSVSQGIALKRFEAVLSHGHGSLSYTFSSRNLRFQSPGIVNDVQLGSVAINNQTGLNAGTIIANTATPTVSMQYIIKAY